MPGDVEIGLEAGFFRYLTKPIRVQEFMATLSATLAFSDGLLPGTPFLADRNGERPASVRRD